MIIDPQHPIKGEERNWQRNDVTFQSSFPDFDIESDAHSYTITYSGGRVAQTEPMAVSPFTNYQRALMSATHTMECVKSLQEAQAEGAAA